MGARCERAGGLDEGAHRRRLQGVRVVLGDDMGEGCGGAGMGTGCARCLGVRETTAKSR